MFPLKNQQPYNPIINKKLNPPLLPDENVSHEERYLKYFVWLMTIKQNVMNHLNNRNDQIVPNFESNKRHN